MLTDGIHMTSTVSVADPPDIVAETGAKKNKRKRRSVRFASFSLAPVVILRRSKRLISVECTLIVIMYNEVFLTIKAYYYYYN